MKNYYIVASKFENGNPVEFKAKFNNGESFHCGFESEELANIGAQLFELVNYNFSFWLKAFPLTLRMWGIKSEWAEN